MKRLLALLILVLLIFTIVVGIRILPVLGINKDNASAALPAPTAKPTSNPIVTENALPGTTEWKIPAGKEATTQIQAYASARSVAPGQAFTFYVSTQQAGTNYKIQFYRMGWYQGKGGHLLMTTNTLTGQAQGYYDDANSTLVNCTTCYVDATTGLIEARWQPSYTFTVPSNWTTGVYLAKVVDAQGMQTYVSFDILGSATSTYVVVTADTTYAAYNNWGGRSLYDYNSKPARASKVSFDRPSTQQYGSDQVLVFEADAIHWMERNGYDLSYISSLDLQTGATKLTTHKAYIALGHDEYWTKEMRDGVEYLRDHGMGLAFFEADDGDWQARLEPSTMGVANQTVVCYKVSTYSNDLARDPLYGVDNSRVTSLWRDPVVNRPQNALLGVMYSDLTHGKHGFPWTVDTSASSPLLKNTGLVPGQKYGCGLVGYEWDKVFNNGATPANLKILGTTPTVNESGQADSSNTTVYIASSRAMVFATGGIYWTSALDTYQFDPDPTCAGTNSIIPGMQQLMKNVMAGIIVLH